jgi:hypothetical protein
MAKTKANRLVDGHGREGGFDESEPTTLVHEMSFPREELISDIIYHWLQGQPR